LGEWYHDLPFPKITKEAGRKEKSGETSGIFKKKKKAGGNETRLKKERGRKKRV